MKTCSLDCKKKFVACDLGFFVDVYIMRGCLCIFWLHLDDEVISWESNNPSDFVAQSFCEF